MLTCCLSKNTKKQTMLKTLFLLSTFFVVSHCIASSVKILDPKVSFQAVHRLGANIWASGTHGGIYNSQDNGVSWQKITGPENSQELQFRDIQLLADGSVVLMSAGEGQSSRVYRSDASIQHWQLQLQGSSAEAFYNCLYFRNSQQGWLYGDSDKAGLFILSSEDGGKNWQRQNLPFDAQTGEGGFASSGTCVNTGQDKHIYIGSGNAKTPRILINTQQGWKSLDTPLAGGEAAGVFSVQQQGEWLYVFGGSLKIQQNPAVATRYNLLSQQWNPLPQVPLKGAIYGSALLTNKGKTHVFIANPQGVSRWQEGETSWTNLSANNIWSLACEDKFGCIGVGKDGVIELFELP